MVLHAVSASDHAAPRHALPYKRYGLSGIYIIYRVGYRLYRLNPPEFNMAEQWCTMS
jgi:hypothetical protein